MTKKSQLALCNTLLLASFLLTSATAVAMLLMQRYTPWLMWPHSTVGAVFIATAYWHLLLNLGAKRWKNYPKNHHPLKSLSFS